MSIGWSVILGLILLLTPGFRVAAADGEAGQSSEFLRYGVNVRSLGMGRAYVALADDASALYYNPAGLMRLDRKYSFYGSHFEPFYESRFNSVSFAINRANRDATGLRGFFFGPKSALGFSVISLASEGYELRDESDNLLDDNFGLYQWALMIGFARETAGTAGILGYGATIKVVRQGVTDATVGLGGSESSFGLDVGAQLQMLNPPVLKELTRVPLIGTFFHLRYLMPLRLGVSIRNVIAPNLGYGGERDRYPAALRIGAGYHLPNDWPLHNLRLTLVSDFEWLYDDIDRLIRFERAIEIHKVPPGSGQYFGTECRYRTEKVQLFSRFGLSHVYDDTKFSAGFGLAFEVSDFDFQVDFAHGFHEELADDQRFSLSVRFGSERDSRYFSDENLPALRPRERNLQVVARYPERIDLVRQAVDSLALKMDSTDVPGQKQRIRVSPEADLANTERYRRLVQDVTWARILAERAFAAFQRFDTSTARTLAAKADEVFASWDQGEFGNRALMDHGQTLLILGRSDRAADRLEQVQSHQPRSHYYLGLAYQNQGKHDQAAGAFADAVRASGGKSRWADLAGLELGRSLLQLRRYDSVVAVTAAIVADYDGELDKDYPRFRYFPDGDVADDAQYLMGRAHLAAGRTSEAIAAWAAICRLYSDLDYCDDETLRRDLEMLIMQMNEETSP